MMSTLRRRRARRPTPIAERGFSLVELLVALLLLAFVSLGIISAMDQGFHLNGSSRAYTTVSNLARGRLEQLLALRFDDAALVPGTPFTETTADGQYTLSYVVTEHSINPATPDPVVALASTAGLGTGNLKLIRVTAAAVGGFGAGRRTITVEAVKHAR